MNAGTTMLTTGLATVRSGSADPATLRSSWAQLRGELRCQPSPEHGAGGEGPGGLGGGCAAMLQIEERLPLRGAVAVVRDLAGPLDPGRPPRWTWHVGSLRRGPTREGRSVPGVAGRAQPDPLSAGTGAKAHPNRRR